MPYSVEIDEVARAFGDAFGSRTRLVALTLVLAAAHGGGDALAGLVLYKERQPEYVIAGLQKCFPKWKPRGRWLGAVLMDLLDHRTGNATIDDVLSALGATMHGIPFSRALESTKRK